MKFLGLICAGCIALTLAACGGGSGSTSSTAKTGTTTNAANTNAANTSTATIQTSTASKAFAARPVPTVHVPPGPPPKKLIIKDLEKGDGAPIKNYVEYSAHYVAVKYATGKKFQIRWSYSSPFTVEFGPGMEIKGWEKGLVGMRVGGRRELIVPSELAYRESGPLVYVIDLLSIKAPEE